MTNQLLILKELPVDFFAASLMVFYCFIILWLSLYGVNAYYLIYQFHKFGRSRTKTDQKIIENFWKDRQEKSLPQITIQLPVYNEKYVIQRLLKAVCNLKYPRNLLEIQVLDDSTDETKKISEELVNRYHRKGYRIKHITRTNREGFKAGALAEGMEKSTGEFLAIFDADFLPPEDFLQKTIPFFDDSGLALVQTRWGHINPQYSLLTKAVSIGIDGHFMVEQGGRNWSGLFMNFNGTAGIWRKKAILDAGGWQADTLTEDMDLSYRANLRGWKMRYLSSVVTPGEIPVDINALKSQQYRWAKGSIQTAKKILPVIIKSSAPLKIKIQSFFHLTHYMIHILVLLVAVLSIPIILVSGFSFLNIYFYIFLLVLLLVSTCGPSTLYIYSQKALRKDWKGRRHLLPFLVILGYGIAVSNSKAVMEALLNVPSGFIRTPKLNITNVKEDFKKKQYKIPLNSVFLIEILMGIYCLFGVFLYWKNYQVLIGPFLIVYTIGFSYVAIISFLHSRSR